MPTQKVLKNPEDHHIFCVSIFWRVEYLLAC